MDAVSYISYILTMSAAIFLAGRIFPRNWIDHNSFPYCPCSFEHNGAIYDRLRVKMWKDKWPNASLLLHRLCRRIPQKSVTTTASRQFMTLLKESCVAESTHCVAAVFGFLYTVHMPSRWGISLSLLNCLVNIPPIIIQRYNRPRYIKAYESSLRRENRQKYTYENM